jgi:hypothetical protein
LFSRSLERGGRDDVRTLKHKYEKTVKAIYGYFRSSAEKIFFLNPNISN